jgi:hypothetical protein
MACYKNIIIIRKSLALAKNFSYVSLILIGIIFPCPQVLIGDGVIDTAIRRLMFEIGNKKGDFMALYMMEKI